MEFKPYQHIERLGTDEVEGILDGTIWVYTKLDGTNFNAFLNDCVVFRPAMSLLLGVTPFLFWVSEGVNSPPPEHTFDPHSVARFHIM